MRQGSEASSDGGEEENDVQDMFAAWKASTVEKKKKQEKELLKLMDKTKKDYLKQAKETRERTKQEMSNVYAAFLEKDAELSTNIRKLWVKVLETHKMVHVHAEDAAKEHKETAAGMRTDIQKVEQDVTATLEGTRFT
ncbi:hypothetical protein CALVIDRAFT_141561 [Calocera viscosa TUFC12733]|uniref:Uncharacterized protein n=1 Tax=Calocera viscosa (strain TUFC12733) TaxID=1330018 RepID=A0A167LPM6_CALVF|nr:hypothetical protein CALVIDRAFT_141561 [Calocera viscosa TUFC12733]